MPEIKRNFTGGKMNKDADERLVPKGEYRDAMNVQVSTSEDDEAGTIQNVLGNQKVNWPSTLAFPAGNSKTIGSISDEKNNFLYWLVRENTDTTLGAADAANWPNAVFKRKNMIYRLNTDPGGIIEAVFIDVADVYIRTSGGVDASGNISIPTNEALNEIIVGQTIDIYHTPSAGFPAEYIAKNVLVVDMTFNTNSPGGSINIGLGDLIQNYNLQNASTLSIVIKKDGALEFPLHPNSIVGTNNIPSLITAINIVDDLLFWTDGVTEPKKINISRSIEGTDQNGNTHTKVINPDQQISMSDAILTEKHHVTVIKKPPTAVLDVEKIIGKETANGDTPLMNFIYDTSIGAGSGNTPPGTKIVIVLNSSNAAIFIPFVGYSSTGLYPVVGDSILLQSSSSTGSLPENYDVEISLVNLMYSGVLNGNGNFDPTTSTNYNVNYLGDPTGPEWVFYAEVTYINPNLTQSDISYNWVVKTKPEQSFKNKFPRFSYRYKYIDGEYSSFGPFTNIIFSPGSFEYNPIEAYNIGMQNNIKSIKLQNYDLNLPKDVVAIDLLYKESNSPAVYLIDTLSPKLPSWAGIPGYEVKGEISTGMLPENQLLRPYDNVPRSALSQEIVANRLVYGNYLQNYDVFTISSSITGKLASQVVGRALCDKTELEQLAKKSLKSMRNYSLGISYLDKYGRQTPVFTSQNNDVKIPISRSIEGNQLKITPSGDFPEWVSYYKIFIKETSREYYNLAMDRVYDADDGNLWLSFPSSDRNKVDEETFLILKKGGEINNAVLEDNKFKILAIENEAPDFIKTKRQYVAKNAGGLSTTAPQQGITDLLFTDPNAVPVKDSNKIIISATDWDQNETPLTDVDEDLVVRFAITTGAVEQKTDYYDVVDFTAKYNTNVPPTVDEYHFTLDRPIEEDFLTNTPVISSTGINETLRIIVYKNILNNSPQFDGRFFAKIKRNALTNSTILNENLSTAADSLVTRSSMPFYYLADTNSGVTGNDTATVGAETETAADWNNRLKFGTSTRKSAWFIDSCYYKGSYTAETLNESGMYTRPSQDAAAYNLQKTDGFRKGIYQENGKFYIDLSYGYLWNAKDNRDTGDSPTGSDGKLHLDAQDNPGLLLQAKNERSQNNHVPGEYYGEMLYYPQSASNDLLKHWRVGSNSNINHESEAGVTQSLVQGSKFKFRGDSNNTIYTIVQDPVISYHNNHTDIDNNLDAYQAHQTLDTLGTNPAYWGLMGSSHPDITNMFNAMANLGHPNNRRITYKIEIDADPTGINTNFNPISAGNADHQTVGAIEFIDQDWEGVSDQVVPQHPAIWETEPKQDIDLDLYYEVDGTFVSNINSETNYTFAPIGTKVTICNPMLVNVVSADKCITRTVVAWDNNIVEFDQPFSFLYNTTLSPYIGRATFHRRNGSCLTAQLQYIFDPTSTSTSAFGTTQTGNRVIVTPDVSNMPINLSYFNCYSFGNGVESNRVRDGFNKVTIDKGVKASSTTLEEYREEKRKYGLIYSGIYNSDSGVNNLNQFIAAEKITKDINPIYGSIQKLHTRDSDLVAICEDRVLKILAKKDALFNADGNAQLTSTNNVLGQTVPFVGKFGISKNPESFASHSYRSYFTDKVRGAVIRLSKDGLTPISDHGMKDWFRDNLKLYSKLIGSFDDKTGEYNITLTD